MADSLHSRVYMAGVPAVAPVRRSFREGGWRILVEVTGVEPVSEIAVIAPTTSVVYCLGLTISGTGNEPV